MRRNNLFILIIIGLILTGLLIGFVSYRSYQAKNQPPCFRLKKPILIWGTDSEKVWKNFANGFQKKFCAKVKYQQVSEENFYSQLVSALSIGQGPDLIIFPSDQFAKYKNLLFPFSKQFQKKINLNAYPEWVKEIIQENKKIYALPLSVDALVLIWNPRILYSQGLLAPPSTWEELAKVIPQIKIHQEENNELILSPIALGGIDNIVRSKEIFSWLMDEFGLGLPDKQGRIENFQASASRLKEVVLFYFNFADPLAENYSWDFDQKENDFYNFAFNKTAMIIAFSQDQEKILKINPRAKFKIAPLLKFAQKETKSNYGKAKLIGITKISAYKLPAQYFAFWVSQKPITKIYSQQVFQIPPFVDQYQSLPEDKKILAKEVLLAKNYYLNNQALSEFFEELRKSTPPFQNLDERFFREIYYQLVKTK